MKYWNITLDKISAQVSIPLFIFIHLYVWIRLLENSNIGMEWPNC